MATSTATRKRIQRADDIDDTPEDREDLDLPDLDDDTEDDDYEDSGDAEEDEEDGAGDHGGPRRDRQATRVADRLLGIGRAGQAHKIVQGPVPRPSASTHGFDGRW